MYDDPIPNSRHGDELWGPVKWSGDGTTECLCYEWLEKKHGSDTKHKASPVLESLSCMDHHVQVKSDLFDTMVREVVECWEYCDCSCSTEFPIPYTLVLNELFNHNSGFVAETDFCSQFIEWGLNILRERSTISCLAIEIKAIFGDMLIKAILYAGFGWG
jgi:hypothetical protein